MNCRAIFNIIPTEATAYWTLHPGEQAACRMRAGLRYKVRKSEWQRVYGKHSLALKCSYFLSAMWQLRSRSNRFQAEECGTMSPNEITAWGKDFFEAGWNVITQVGLLPGHWCLKHFQFLWKVPQDLLMTAKEWPFVFLFFFFFFLYFVLFEYLIWKAE